MPLFFEVKFMQSMWMLLAAFLFSIMGVGVKAASQYYSTAEIVAYRGAISMLLIYVLMRWRGGTLRSNMVGQHLWRGIVGVAALWMWFFAIAHLPLAMAVTLNYTSPIWIAAILFVGAWWHRRERLNWGFVGAILLGFIGMLLLLRPSMHRDQLLSGVIALSSGFLAALAYIQVRQMGLRGEPEYRVVFYFSATCMVVGVIGALVVAHFSVAPMVTWHAHETKSLLLLLLVGVTAASAQMAMTRAYRLGNPLLTANLQYLGIVFSSLWDLLLWHDSLSGVAWLGVCVILASGVMASFYNARHRRATKLVETDTIVVNNLE